MDEMTKKLIELYEQNIALLKENNELKLKLAQKNNSYPSITVTPLSDLPQTGIINTPYVHSTGPTCVNADSFRGNLLLTSDDIKHLRNGIPHVG